MGVYLHSCLDCTGRMSVRAVSLLGASLSLCTRSLCWPHTALQAVGGAGPVRLQLKHLGWLTVQPEGCLPHVLWNWESEQSFWGLCCGVSLRAFPCEAVEVKRSAGMSQATRSEPQSRWLQADRRLRAVTLCSYPEVKESAQQPRPGLLTTVPFTASAEFLKIPASGPSLHSDLPWPPPNQALRQVASLPTGWRSPLFRLQNYLSLKQQVSSI